jgi:hypothetical protein
MPAMHLVTRFIAIAALMHRLQVSSSKMRIIQYAEPTAGCLMSQRCQEHAQGVNSVRIS